MDDDGKTISLKRQGGPSEFTPSVNRPVVAAPARDVEPRFGRYELLMELASGGMATMFLARLRGPESFEKLVAIKIIHAHLTREQSFVEMFHDEARISALVHHPNVVQIFDLGAIEDRYYIAMEFVRGQDYRAVLKHTVGHARSKDTSLPLQGWLYAARVAADAAAGLHAAHELCSSGGEPLGLVHRDVSPHNILISYDGHVKLTDFGIAYAKHRMTHTASGVLKGKTAYMSPEQATGDPIDRRSDLFALGTVLWEALTLKRLFRRESDTATLYALTHKQIPSPRAFNVDLPVPLERIVMRTLARDPAERYQTGQELQRALETFISRSDEVVGAEELKGLMSLLFAERKARVDEEISARLAQPPTQAASPSQPSGPSLPSLLSQTGPTRAPGETHETKLSAQAHSAPVARDRRSRSLTMGLVGVALVLVIAISGYFLLRGTGADSRRGAAPPPSGKTAPAAAGPGADARARPIPARPTSELLMITFSIKPAEAKPTILFRGKRYRQSRLDLLVGAGKTTELVRVEAPGYEPQTRHVTVRKEAKLTHEFALRPLKQRPIHRPLRRPPRRRGGTPTPVDIDFE
ncbi:MAG: protein kinase [bacterium]